MNDEWKLVPVEPTKEMCRTGLAERHDDLAKSIYKAMLGAAPQPPSVGGEVKRYVRGPEKMEAYSQGDWIKYSDLAARDQQIAELQALLKRAVDWIEAARDGVLYPVANDFDGGIGHNADGLGQLSADLLPELKAALAKQVNKDE